jgi:hypothetical protein
MPDETGIEAAPVALAHGEADGRMTADDRRFGFIVE